MSTPPSDTGATPQWREALDIANSAKRERYLFRTKARRIRPYRSAWQIAAGSLRNERTPSPAIGAMEVNTWLLAWPGIRQVTADRLLRYAQVGHGRRLGDLTNRERSALATQLERLARRDNW